MAGVMVLKSPHEAGSSVPGHQLLDLPQAGPTWSTDLLASAGAGSPDESVIPSMPRIDS